MKVPKIPTGITAVSTTSIGIGLYAQHRVARHNQRTNETITQQGNDLSKQIADNHQESMLKLRELSEQNAQLQEQLRDATTTIKDINTKKFVEFNDMLPTWDSITDYFTKLYDFGGSLPFEYGIVLIHLLVLVIILFLLVSHISVLYGNYLIQKFDLHNKYPKLHKFLKYRMMYQKFYMFYNAIIALSLLLIFIVIDVLILIDF